MTEMLVSSANKKPASEEVSVTVRLPKPLHRKLTEIAAGEGKSLTDKLAQAAREHAATYERTSKTVTAYTRKKP